MQQMAGCIDIVTWPRYVADPGAAASMLALALGHSGRIDFLVTGAAVSAPEMFHRTTPQRFDAVTGTNIGRTAHVAMACSARMREAGDGLGALIEQNP